MDKKTIIFLFFSFISSITLSSQQEKQAELKYTLDWKSGKLSISLTQSTREKELSPISPYITQREIESLLPYYIKLAMEKIQVNSRENISDILLKQPQLNLQLLEIDKEIKNKNISYSDDLDSLTISVDIELFPSIAELLINHSMTEEIPHRLGWVAADSFTGLVIDAKGELPIYGTENKGKLIPAIFPRIFNSRGELILSVEMLDPKTAKKTGIAAYTDSYDEKPFLNRIGQKPLRIKAKAIFGKNPTDIVLPEEAIKLLLAKDENRKILQEGKILIICDNVIQEEP
ncbi:hypothetical protein WKV44_09645 [Spirochaetia bacterium 38H-sp]|uniref:Uncharacterized protein n=1 Tax=Rarispira pelagica TaxID=3141764 RepID=A0ABU9UDR5_9SPIR